MKLPKYELVIFIFCLLAIIGFSLMYAHEDWLWLIPMWFMIRFNHLCLSLHHRLISHRSFTAGSEFKKNLIIFLSIFQVNHSPLKFAISHRHHHKHSDKELDIHGPVRGLWDTLFWEFGLEKKFKSLDMKIQRDLIRDKFLVAYDKHYYKILFAVSVLVYLISAKFFWYVFVPASILWKVEANLFVNWYCHCHGYVNYTLETDTAKNNNWAGWLTMGEGWHNNHHADPSNYNFGHRAHEIDLTSILIKHYFGKTA